MKVPSTKPYNILTDYRPENNKVVDSLALIIMQFRKRKLALKAIYVKEPLYGYFKKWVEDEYKKVEGKSIPEGSPLSFDKVNIEKGSIFQVNIFQVETFNDFNNNNIKLLN
jgi:hypothetical protein